MSWLTRLQQQIIIRTGDGRTYEPQWINANLQQEYNLAIFNFPNLAGSLVTRRQPRGRRFGIEIYFIGEDHIDVSESFRRSAEDRRAWTITHPFYDEILVQPTRLNFDNANYNLTMITGEVVETITDRLPRRTENVEDIIVEQKTQLDSISASMFSDQVGELIAVEIVGIQDSIDQLEASGNTILEVQEDQVAFRNLILNAQREVNNIVTEPLAALRSIQAAINFPSQIVAGIQARVENLTDAFERVVESFANITGISRNNKVYTEAAGATIISAFTQATLENRDIQTRAEIQNNLDAIFNLYNRYIEILDSFQTATQTEVNSYAPDADTQIALSQLMFLLFSSLFDISLESQQQLSIRNEADSNVIILTHRVYGLDDDDVNIDRFIETNNIGLNEMLKIEKDREIVYFA